MIMVNLNKYNKKGIVILDILFDLHNDLEFTKYHYVGAV